MTGRLGVIEDSPEDWMILQRLLRKLAPDLPVVRFDSGDNAIAALREGEEIAALVVDLNLPRLSGPGFVAEVRADDALRLLPIIVMSGSNRPEDIDAVYAAGANAYVRKPLDVEAFREVLEVLVRWLAVIELPGGGRQRGADAWS